MYNVEKYIETCINSILAQTFQNFEVIVIDDRSTDRSFEIVSKYTDPRIRLMQNIQNSERSFTRNVGLECSQGEFIFFMDSDDALMPDALETFMNTADESGADVIFMNSWFSTRDENVSFKSGDAFSIPSKDDLEKHVIKDSRPRFLSTDIEKRIHWDFIKQTVPVVPWIKIQRRECLFNNRIYFPLINRREDVLFNFAELCLIEKIQVIDACCYIYRNRKNNTLRAHPEKQIRETISSLPEAMNFINKIISQMHITESLKLKIKNIIEPQTIRSYFAVFLCRAYRSNMTQEEIDSVLLEMFRNPKIFDPNLMRILFNFIATELIK
ncbi:MAG: glycosyltransferase family 2 protein [Selenomonadaceae bacterium]|nr:glycosyltransferase family 2 protein [Selenomonadaceae bacterium]